MKTEFFIKYYEWLKNKLFNEYVVKFCPGRANLHYILLVDSCGSHNIEALEEHLKDSTDRFDKQIHILLIPKGMTPYL